MTDDEWARINEQGRRSRVSQGLSPELPPDAVERVRAVFAGAARDRAERRTMAPFGDVVRRARRQALLGDLLDGT